MPDPNDPFAELMRDTVSVLKEGGRRFDDVKANVHSKGIRISDVSLPLEEGDRVVRTLPNGVQESYVVTDTGYSAGLFEIPPSYNLKVRKDTKFAAEQDSSTIYNLYGNNPRVNIHSEDKSVNVATVTAENLFTDLRRVLETGIEDPDHRSALLALTNQMEQNQGTPTFTDRYKDFIATAADHLALVQPFVPALTQMLGA